MTHDVEDVDLPGLTPWEEETVRMAINSLRRHGFKVSITGPGGTLHAPPRGNSKTNPRDPDAADNCTCALCTGPKLAVPASLPPWGGAELLEPGPLPVICRELSPEEVTALHKAWDVVGPQSPLIVLDAFDGYDGTLDCPCPLHQAARDGAL